MNAEEGREWPPRRRFTIGHELGHFVLHSDGERSLFCRSTAVQADEQPDPKAPPPDLPDIEEEASVFAAALLMPARLVRREYEVDREFFEALRLLRRVRRGDGPPAPRGDLRLRPPAAPPGAP